jgi:hypothetical protein
MCKKVVRYAKARRFIRKQFLVSLIKNKVKFDYLKQVWTREVEEIYNEICIENKSKAGKKKLKEFVRPNPKLSDEFLKLYLRRVKWLYSMVFW